jgi:hypothetical protein
MPVWRFNNNLFFEWVYEKWRDYLRARTGGKDVKNIISAVGGRWTIGGGFQKMRRSERDTNRGEWCPDILRSKNNHEKNFVTTRTGYVVDVLSVAAAIYGFIFEGRI